MSLKNDQLHQRKSIINKIINQQKKTQPQYAFCNYSPFFACAKEVVAVFLFFLRKNHFVLFFVLVRNTLGLLKIMVAHQCSYGGV